MQPDLRSLDKDDVLAARLRWPFDPAAQAMVVKLRQPFETVSIPLVADALRLHVPAPKAAA